MSVIHKNKISGRVPDNKNRKILHVDMDAFFVSVEETLDPSLKGKPVVVGGDPNGRGVAAAASYEARKFGIHSAMPLAQARRLCPHAIFLRGSHKSYSEFSARIFELLENWSPRVEPMSLDEAYIDLTGCERLFGPAPEVAEKIRDEIKIELGINASIGIATNKLLAKVGSAHAKPNGMLRILPGREREFLAPLGIDRIPGIGPKSGTQLRRMGIKTVNDLTVIPRQLLEEVFGKWGTSLYFKSRGICDSQVLKRDDTRSISRETTFDDDSIDPAFLESALSALVEKATAQLRESDLHTRCVTLKLRYSDFTTVTRSRTLVETANGDCVIYTVVSDLFRKLFTRRSRIRLIGVALTSLTSAASAQMDLFDHIDKQRQKRLYQGIDSIRDKYGFGSILRAASYRGTSA